MKALRPTNPVKVVMVCDHCGELLKPCTHSPYYKHARTGKQRCWHGERDKGWFFATYKGRESFTLKTLKRGYAQAT